ncbi:MAG: flagellar motor switch protein FliN [Gammaproteobacteria bacterium]|nr:flagellar motor switch protein FliN [Gammaproteobacteria bacterium]
MNANSTDTATAGGPDDAGTERQRETEVSGPQDGATAAPPDAAASSASIPANGEVNLDVILDISVTLSMEAGRTRVPIRNLLQLTQGSVLELDRTAGEPLDVYVNGTLIAHGEVVVVNDKFGIRLTDVISPAERIRRLR